jgi:foldase protein PrsA
MNTLLKAALLLLCASTLSMASEVLAVVNGQNITTEVAPKNFKSMDRALQKKIINRLIEKRLASDYALSTPISESEEFKKTLKHVLQMNSDLKDKKEEEKFLANILKKDAKIKGYTEEQLYSKKGLLAFDFLVNEQADKIKAALTQKELKEYYELNKYKYDTPAMKELLTIVVEDQNKANTIIDELAKSKNKLETFRALAQKYSLAPSASKNGYFGKIPTEQLNDQLKPLLKDLKKSEYSQEPIKTEFGYQIFYILNDIAKFNSRFELVKSKVENEFMQQKVKQWASDTIKKLKQEANISIKYL